MRKITILGLVLVVCIIGFYSLFEPQLNRNWSPDQVVLPSAEFIEDNKVLLSNVRNFKYSSTTSYEIEYYDLEVDLNKLERVDYIVEPFGSIGAAHTFLSFAFEDGNQVAVSIEIRKEIGESFSPLKGLLRQYEVMYVVADERDVVNLRANHRQHAVYIYPTVANREQGILLFKSMLNRANELKGKPEFYNTLTNNCTTNIVKHINDVFQKDISWDLRLLLPEESDALAKELGFIAQDISIEEARVIYKVNERAELYKGSQDFSKLIRLPLEESAAKNNLYRVTKVVDGDTIDVEINGQTKRVRYIGIDTPESQLEDKPAECFALEATARNQALVENKWVRLEKDVSETDKYGRLLRYVFVGDKFINQTLVEEGYASVFTVPPDVAQKDTFIEAQRKAKTEEKGLWGSVCTSL